MSPPSQWGPPTWFFLHTMAEKIKEDSYPIIGKQLITIITQICGLLPCPDCSEHSKQFWGHVKIDNVLNKLDLINLLFVFHNTVNKRKQLLPFPYDNLQYYKNKNIVETFNNFAKNYNTKGNMNMLTESFHRERLLGFIRKWIINNLGHFNK